MANIMLNDTATMRLVDLADIRHVVMRQPTDVEREKLLSLLGDWRSTVTVTSTDILPCDTLVAGTVPEIEHKLKPATCVNCGGRIDKDTLTCCYCGTFYQ